MELSVDVNNEVNTEVKLNLLSKAVSSFGRHGFCFLLLFHLNLTSYMRHFLFGVTALLVWFIIVYIALLRDVQHTYILTPDTRSNISFGMWQLPLGKINPTLDSRFRLESRLYD